jgi:hypothetical protein
MEVQVLPEATTSRKEKAMSTLKHRELGLPLVPAVPTLKKKLEYLLYKRGREDGESGRPLANLTDVYLQGYILGLRKLDQLRGS